MAKYICHTDVKGRSFPEIKPESWVPLVTKEGTLIEATEIAGGWLKYSVDVYSRKEWFNEKVDTPPPVSGRKPPMLGVHVRHHTVNADWALSQGCPFVVVLGDKLGAVQMAQKYPGKKVCYRSWFGNARLTPAEMIQTLGVAKQDPPMLFVGYNEYDSIGGSAEDLKTHALFDIEVAKRIKDINPGSLYLAATFPHGNPDITKPEICDVLRQYYAPGYNSGLFGADLHNYSKLELQKDRNQKPAEPDVWLLRRWEWFFTKCGFDPKVRNIWSTETGVEAGAGGFRWAENYGWGDKELLDWCKLHQRENGRDLIINGISYPSPYQGGAIFQMGLPDERGSGSWEGYNIVGRRDLMKEFWA